MNQSTNEKVLSLKEVYEDHRNRIFWYWCNACGDINVPGRVEDCGAPDDMPPEARELYEKLWSEDLCQTCYVVQYNTTFGVALHLLLDDGYIEDLIKQHDELKKLNLDEALLKKLRTQAGKKTAEEIYDVISAAFPMVTVFYGTGTDPDGDEILIFLPKQEFDALSEDDAREMLSLQSELLDKKYGYPVFEELFCSWLSAPAFKELFGSLESAECKTASELLEDVLKNKIAENEINVQNGNHSGYDGGYAEGYHDALVEIMNALHIQHDEEFYN